MTAKEQAERRVRESQQLAERQLASGASATLAQLRSSNVGEMIESLATGVAQAQFELDAMSIRLARLMTGEPLVVPHPRFPNDRSFDRIVDTRVQFGAYETKGGSSEPAMFSLMELGFTPTFYQFTETTLEVKLSVSMSADISIERKEDTKTTEKTKKLGFFKTKTTTKVTSVSSRFSAKYQFSVEGSSYVRTKLVPVPPPASLLEAMRVAAEEAAVTAAPA